MKKILFVFAMTIALISCKDNTPKTITVDTNTKTVEKETTKEDLAANYNKAEFKIDGMTCAIGCAKRIEGKLAAMEGVKSAKVDFEQKLAMVEYNDAKVDFDALTSTVSKVAGDYKVSDMKNVETFSTNEAKKECAADCKKACCAKKEEAEKMACAKDCKKACCATKA
ncbi:Cu+-exporting ATPase [Kordia periserrulae]|uniref:Cu+-exporting ATPase n=1 Tax=Kordia periserrulae TaxID=701523 RepID=A0A2T6BVM1_9FLAO|nr:heavy metal-associated domain-containing protein [Kordia periserrulae]PTX60027.1 Cu+-exporting ATPase [Kordia periserrulae]